MIYGADTKQLRELAASFALTAQTLRDTSGSLSRTVSTTPWRGGDADQFRTGWQMVNRARMESAAGAIEDASAALRRNADEQDRASGVMGEESGAQTGDFGGAVPDLNASREDVETWWASLSSEEQAEWLRDRPGSLGNREGIPLEVRYDANRRVIENSITRLASVDQTLGSIEDIRQSMESILRSRVNVLYFDPETLKTAVVYGNLDTADEVAITVQGTGNNFEKFVPSDSGGFMVESAALTSAPRNRAVIATFVWDPPPQLYDNVGVGRFTDTMGHEMDNVVNTAVDHVDKVVLVGHSAGTNAIQDWAARSPVAEGVDGYVMLAAPDPFDQRFLESIGDRPVAYGYHNGDPIAAVTVDDTDDALTYIRSDASNVSMYTADAGVAISSLNPLDWATKDHSCSRYLINFEDSAVNGTFDAVNPQS